MHENNSLKREGLFNEADKIDRSFSMSESNHQAKQINGVRRAVDQITWLRKWVNCDEVPSSSIKGICLLGRVSAFALVDKPMDHLKFIGLQGKKESNPMECVFWVQTWCWWIRLENKVMITVGLSPSQLGRNNPQRCKLSNRINLPLSLKKSVLTHFLLVKLAYMEPEAPLETMNWLKRNSTCAGKFCFCGPLTVFGNARRNPDVTRPYVWIMLG